MYSETTTVTAHKLFGLHSHFTLNSLLCLSNVFTVDACRIRTNVPEEIVVQEKLHAFIFIFQAVTAVENGSTLHDSEKHPASTSHQRLQKGA